MSIIKQRFDQMDVSLKVEIFLMVMSFLVAFINEQLGLLVLVSGIFATASKPLYYSLKRILETLLRYIVAIIGLSLFLYIFMIGLVYFFT